MARLDAEVVTTNGNPSLGTQAPSIRRRGQLRDAAARRAIEESGLNERLVDVLDRVFLMDRCGQAVEADRTAAEFR